MGAGPGMDLKDVLSSMKTMIGTGAWGLCFNVLTFAVVNYFTREQT